VPIGGGQDFRAHLSFLRREMQGELTRVACRPPGTHDVATSSPSKGLRYKVFGYASRS
jgi:hypothetical protein